MFGLKEIWCFWKVFPGGSVVKNPLAKQETLVWSLDWEDLLEEGMATYSNILDGKISWTEEPGGLWFMGSQKVRLDWSNWVFMPTMPWRCTDLFLKFLSSFRLLLVQQTLLRRKHLEENLRISFNSDPYMPPFASCVTWISYFSS